ncbi:unnamed protein product, partial [Closterium sp. Naga37s-1]
MQAGGYLADAAAGVGRAQGKGGAGGGKGAPGGGKGGGGDPWVGAGADEGSGGQAGEHGITQSGERGGGEGDVKAVHLKPITQKRQSLPIMAYREEITRAIERHQVVLIVGETGCGKTTQVPQFILDHEWGKGRRCRVMCTQPRRISATSVAERIAAERGEKIGQTVGYQIRLESKGNRSSSLWLCTNGVLLRRLVGLGAHLHSREGGRSAQGGGGGGGGGMGSGEGGGGSIVEPGVREAIAAAVKGMAEAVDGDGDGDGEEGEGVGGAEGEEKGGVGREVDADVLAKLDATHIIVVSAAARTRHGECMEFPELGAAMALTVVAVTGVGKREGGSGRGGGCRCAGEARCDSHHR